MPDGAALRWLARLALCVALSIAGAGCGSRPRVSALAPDGSASFALMEWSQPLPLDPPPAGWHHRVFLRHDPMDVSFVQKDGRAAIRLATRDTASMLFRQVDVPLDDYPYLVWEWLIEQPIETDLDETTVAGDDHPARLYLTFRSANGEQNAMEIVWGNRLLRAGDWKHLTFYGLFDFPHYVANGSPENAGRWHRERVDLRQLHRELWGDPAQARLVELALFCDTDETGAESVAYFGEIRVERAERR